MKNQFVTFHSIEIELNRRLESEGEKEDDRISFGTDHRI